LHDLQHVSLNLPYPHGRPANYTRPLPNHRARRSQLILELYQIIFDVRCLTSSFSVVLKATKLPDTSTPTYRLAESTQKAIGTSAFPLPLITDPEDKRHAAAFQAAYPKLNTCDIACQSMIGPIADKLRETGAKVSWLLIKPRVKFLLRTAASYAHGKQGAAIHSILSITTASGEEYIADFTIEQFGHPKRDWLMKKSKYMEKYAKNGFNVVAPKSHKDEDGECEEPLERRLELEVFCCELDWDVLKELNREGRLRKVAEWAINEFDGDV
jgi:hypothetical protein